jgi:type IV fimbrial biogenesis protein FimT
MHPIRGYTLTELLCSLSILTLLASLALPAFSRVLRDTQSTTAINTFVSVYQLARSTAINNRAVVVMCPTTDNKRCSSDWLTGAMAFTDPNNNREIDDDERVIATMDVPVPGSQIKMAAALNKQYLRFMDNGMLENTAGSIVYCPPNGKDMDARVIIFTRNGRLRFGTDKNKDGIREDAAGTNLHCPL